MLNQWSNSTNKSMPKQTVIFIQYYIETESNFVTSIISDPFPSITKITLCTLCYVQVMYNIEPLTVSAF